MSYFILPALSVFSFLFCPTATVYTTSLYNDLSPLYESSQEVSDSSERLWLLVEGIQGLASFLIKNVSQICPLQQPNYLNRIDKIVLNTLTEIYSSGETLSKIQFYENIIPPIKTTLEKCLNSSKTSISTEDYFSREYAETILHLDLRHRSDISKWQDFRPCIRTQPRSKFYPGILSSTIDTLWQSFLLGYLGCKEHWGTLKEWNFLDVIQQVIIRPLFQRWSSKFPTNTVSTQGGMYNSTNGTISSEITEILSQNEDRRGVRMTLASISYWLEKCNVILFLKHTVDPIPCFRDVIYSR